MIRSILQRVIFRFLSAARSYFFVSAGIMAVLAGIIWFYGPRLSLFGYAPFKEVSYRLIAIMVIVFLWGVNNLWLAYSRRRKKTEPEKSQEVRIIDPLEDDIKALRLGFATAMRKLMQNWAGPEKGKHAIYALPWYLVIGDQGSGKTSLITASDMKFPIAHVFGQDSLHTGKATQEIEYRITDHGVLFDLPGFFTNQSLLPIRSERNDNDDENRRVAYSRNAASRLWKVFLELIVEQRPRRPINGVIICVDVNELVESDETRRNNQAAIIRSRMLEVTETLGTQVTAYVIVTKLDLLDGFSEYFAGLPKEARSQPFGFSFPLKDGVDQLEDWIDCLDEYYQDLAARMNDNMIDRVQVSNLTSERGKIYGFLRQLAGLRPVLVKFLDDALHTNRFSTPPLVRGVYFTSARQEGIPFNPILARVSHDYDMARHVLPAHVGTTRPYFMEGLFDKVIFNEAGLAGDNHRVERKKRYLLGGSVLATSMAVVTIGFFLNLAYTDNWSRAAQVLDSIRRHVGQTHSSSNTNEAGAEHLQALNELRGAMDIFAGYQNTLPWQPAVTLYQGRKIGPEVDKSYVRILADKFLPSVGESLRREIVNLGKDPATADGKRRLNMLRTYLMLGDFDVRDNDWVLDWMKPEWQRRFTGDKKRQAALVSHLDYALNVARISIDLDEPTIYAAQQDLRRIPFDMRLYLSLKQEAAQTLGAPISFKAEIGPSYDLIFDTGPSGNAVGQRDIVIPQFFTQAHFHDFFVPKINALSEAVVRDAWISGERETVSYSEEDVKVFQRKVRDRYTAEYIDTWEEALRELRIVRFNSVNHAVDVLEELTGAANPLGRLLLLTERQTEIYVRPRPKTQDREASATATAAAVANTAITDTLPLSDPNLTSGLRITRAFDRLRRIVVAEKEGDKVYLDDLLLALNALYEYMKEVKTAADPRAVALEKAKARTSFKGNDPIYVIRRLSTNLPPPLGLFFDEIATQSWQVLLLEARARLGDAWDEEIYQPFRLDFANLYPFNPRSQKDVPLAEFERFFGPSGKLARFYKDNLIVFVDPVDRTPREIDGQKMDIDPEFITRVEQALRVKDVYFDTKGVLSLSYTLQPKILTSRYARSTLNIEGQLVPYSHGPTRPIKIIWPNALSTEPISAISAFQRNGRVDSRRYEGSWSSFRLLRAARRSRRHADEIDLTFPFGKSNFATYTMRFTARKNPFVENPLSELRLPEKL